MRKISTKNCPWRQWGEGGGKFAQRTVPQNWRVRLCVWPTTMPDCPPQSLAFPCVRTRTRRSHPYSHPFTVLLLRQVCPPTGFEWSVRGDFRVKRGHCGMSPPRTQSDLNSALTFQPALGYWRTVSFFFFYVKSFHISDIRLILRLSK